MANKSPRLARALDRLAQFDFQVDYITGEDNILADALSRPPHEDPDFPGQTLVENMEKFYKPPGYSAVRVPGGPNSMLSALEMSRIGLIEPPEDKHLFELRKVLVKELIKNSEKYCMNVSKTSVQVYCNMDVTPSLDMCKAFANIHKVRILMYVGVEQPLIFSPEIDGQYEEVRILCLGQGVHFEPLIKMKNLNNEGEEIGLNWVNIENILVEKGVFNWKEDFEIWEAANLEEIVEFNKINFNDHKDQGTWVLPKLVGSPCNIVAHKSVDLMFTNKHNKVCVAIDPAAAISSIAEQALQSLKSMGVQVLEERPNRDTQVRCFGNNIIKPEKVVSLFLHFHGIGGIEHEFFVFKDKDACACMLLGADFLERHKVKVRYTSDIDFWKSARVPGIVVTSSDNTRYEVQSVNVDCNRRNSYATSVLCAVQVKEQVSNSNFIFNVQNVINDYPSILRDIDLEQLLKAIKNKEKKQAPYEFQRNFRKYWIDDNHCIRFGKSTVVSLNYFTFTITELHGKGLHSGAKKVFERIKHQVWHPWAQDLISQVTRSCPICQCTKDFTAIQKPPVKRVKAKEPFEMVSMDIVALEHGSAGNKYAIVFCDYFSKWLQVYPLKNHTASTIVEILKEYLNTIPRCPTVFITDGSTEFNSKLFGYFLEDSGIRHRFSAEYRPNTNGQAENNIKTLVTKFRISKVINNSVKWDHVLKDVVLDFNYSVHSTTQVSPADVVLKSDNMAAKPKEDQGPTWVEGNVKFSPYKKGTRVLLKCHYTGDRCVDKFKPLYKGLYKIAYVKGSGLVYDLADAKNEDCIIKCNVHYNDLRPFKVPWQWVRKIETFNDIYCDWFKTVLRNYIDLYFSDTDRIEDVSSKSSVDDKHSTVTSHSRNNPVHDEVERQREMRFYSYVHSLNKINDILIKLGMDLIPQMSYDQYDALYLERALSIKSFLQMQDVHGTLVSVVDSLIESINGKKYANKLDQWLDEDDVALSWSLENVRINHNYFQENFGHIIGASLMEWQSIVNFYNEILEETLTKESDLDSLEEIVEQLNLREEFEDESLSEEEQLNLSVCSDVKNDFLESTEESFHSTLSNFNENFNQDEKVGNVVERNYRVVPDVFEESTVSSKGEGTTFLLRDLDKLFENKPQENNNNFCSDLLQESAENAEVAEEENNLNITFIYNKNENHFLNLNDQLSQFSFQGLGNQTMGPMSNVYDWPMEDDDPESLPHINSSKCSKDDDTDPNNSESEYLSLRSRKIKRF